MVTGGAFCLLSAFCALMMFHFDKRAQRILRRDEAATGSLCYMLSEHSSLLISSECNVMWILTYDISHCQHNSI